MVRKTIHITEAQSLWLNDNSYNVSRYIRKILKTIMSDKEKAEMFSAKIKSKAELDQITIEAAGLVGKNFFVVSLSNCVTIFISSPKHSIDKFWPKFTLTE